MMSLNFVTHGDIYLHAVNIDTGLFTRLFGLHVRIRPFDFYERLFSVCRKGEKCLLNRRARLHSFRFRSGILKADTKE